MYAGFGSKVTILEAGKRLLPKADREIAEYMQESLKRKKYRDTSECTRTILT